MSVWFDELGTAYARRYAELNEARTVFEEQRLAIVHHLISALRSELPHVHEPKPNSEWLWFEIKDGAYRKAREAIGRSGASYVAFSLGSPSEVPGLDGTLACVPVVYFSMGKPMERRIPEGFIPKLRRWRSTGLNFSTGPIRYGDEHFQLDELEQRVRELPGIFREVDAGLAELVRGTSDD